MTVTNFSVMSGQSHRLLGIINKYAWEKMRLVQGHSTVAPVRIENMQSGALPLGHCGFFLKHYMYVATFMT